MARVLGSHGDGTVTVEADDGSIHDIPEDTAAQMGFLTGPVSPQGQAPLGGAGASQPIAQNVPQTMGDLMGAIGQASAQPATPTLVADVRSGTPGLAPPQAPPTMANPAPRAPAPPPSPQPPGPGQRVAPVFPMAPPAPQESPSLEQRGPAITAGQVRDLALARIPGGGPVQTAEHTVTGPVNPEATAQAMQGVDLAGREQMEATQQRFASQARTNDIAAGGLTTQADVMQGQAQAQQAMQEEQQRNLADALRAHQTLIDDMASHRIDPDRLFSDGYGASRLGAAIAVALGSLGSTFSGQPNAAMQLITDEINRDIMAQEAALRTDQARVGRSENALSMLRQVYGDEAAAAAALRQAKLEEVRRRIEGMVLASETPTILANGRMLMAQAASEALRAQLAALPTEQVRYRVRTGGGGGYAVPVPRLNVLESVRQHPDPDPNAPVEVTPGQMNARMVRAEQTTPRGWRWADQAARDRFPAVTATTRADAERMLGATDVVTRTFLAGAEIADSNRILTPEGRAWAEALAGISQDNIRMLNQMGAPQAAELVILAKRSPSGAELFNYLRMQPGGMGQYLRRMAAEYRRVLEDKMRGMMGWVPDTAENRSAPAGGYTPRTQVR